MNSPVFGMQLDSDKKVKFLPSFCSTGTLQHNESRGQGKFYLPSNITLVRLVREKEERRSFLLWTGLGTGENKQGGEGCHLATLPPLCFNTLTELHKGVWRTNITELHWPGYSFSNLELSSNIHWCALLHPEDSKHCTSTHTITCVWCLRSA